MAESRGLYALCVGSLRCLRGAISRRCACLKPEVYAQEVHIFKTKGCCRKQNMWGVNGFEECHTQEACHFSVAVHQSWIEVSFLRSVLEACIFDGSCCAHAIRIHAGSPLARVISSAWRNQDITEKGGTSTSAKGYCLVCACARDCMYSSFTDRSGPCSCLCRCHHAVLNGYSIVLIHSGHAHTQMAQIMGRVHINKTELNLLSSVLDVPDW